MKSENIDAIIIPGGANNRYITDSEYSSSTLIIPKGGSPNEASQIIANEQYKYVNSQKLFSPWIHYVKAGNKHIKDVLNELKLSKGIIGLVDSKRYSANFYNILTNEFPEVKFKDVTEVYEKLRLVKDYEEIGRLRKSAEVADTAFEKLTRMIKPDVDEYKVLAETGKTARFAGSDVGSLMIGENPLFFFASNPYPGILRPPILGNKFKTGEVVLPEIRSSHQGYWTQIGRTISIGKSSREEKKIFKIVKTASEKAIDAMKPYTPVSNVAKAVNKVIEKTGLKECLRYSLGGGIGLDLQEAPIIGEKETLKLLENMVLSLRICIYKPNIGAALLTDSVLVLRTGPELLTKTSAELLQI